MENLKRRVDRSVRTGLNRRRRDSGFDFFQVVDDVERGGMPSIVELDDLD